MIKQGESVEYLVGSSRGFQYSFVTNAPPTSCMHTNGIFEAGYSEGDIGTYNIASLIDGRIPSFATVKIMESTDSGGTEVIPGFFEFTLNKPTSLFTSNTPVEWSLDFMGLEEVPGISLNVIEDSLASIYIDSSEGAFNNVMQNPIFKLVATSMSSGEIFETYLGLWNDELLF